MGKLTTIFGPMFAGKTTEIQKRCDEAISSGKNVIIIKYTHDNRYTSESEIINHDGHKITSNNSTSIIMADSVNDIIDNISSFVDNCVLDLLIIDEAQFYNGLYDAISTLMTNPRLNNLDIVVAGLDLDAKGNVFNKDFNMLITIADEAVYKLSKCYKCNMQAQLTMRLDSKTNSDQVEIAGSELYQPVCHNCHPDNTISI